MFDIHQQITKVGISFYRCSLSNTPKIKNTEIPTWMFDKILCSKMELLEQPYCSLESIQQLIFLLKEASPAECIIDNEPNAFAEKGDANVRSRSKRKNNNHAAIRTSKSSLHHMEDTNQNRQKPDSNFISQNDNRVSHEKNQKWE